MSAEHIQGVCHPSMSHNGKHHREVCFCDVRKFLPRKGIKFIWLSTDLFEMTSYDK